MSAAERPWRERRVVDGLADALREAVSERFPGTGRSPAKAAPAEAGAAAGQSEADPAGRSGRSGRFGR